MSGTSISLLCLVLFPHFSLSVLYLKHPLVLLLLSRWRTLNLIQVLWNKNLVIVYIVCHLPDKDSKEKVLLSYIYRFLKRFKEMLLLDSLTVLPINKSYHSSWVGINYAPFRSHWTMNKHKLWLCKLGPGMVLIFYKSLASLQYTYKDLH